jgi:hypothetical protein
MSTSAEPWPGLKLRGINVTTTIEAGLIHASDVEQLAFAHGEQRVFVTRDRRILATPAVSSSHAGIVIARTGRNVIGQTVLALTHLHRTVAAEDMNERVEYL